MHISKGICYCILAFLIYTFFLYDTSGASISAQTVYTLVRNNEANISTLNSKVNTMQDNYVSLYRQIESLRRELDAEKQRNLILEKNVEALKSQLISDRKVMQNNLDNVINKVSQETSKAINQAAKQQSYRSSSHSSNNSGPPLNGKYTVYTVQSGATLSAIAKAYDVSVSSIKSANHLDSDIIRVGEKLYIPQN